MASAATKEHTKARVTRSINLFAMLLDKLVCKRL